MVSLVDDRPRRRRTQAFPFRTRWQLVRRFQRSRWVHWIEDLVYLVRG
jgi:hypothetical protein